MFVFGFRLRWEALAIISTEAHHDGLKFLLSESGMIDDTIEKKEPYDLGEVRAPPPML